MSDPTNNDQNLNTSPGSSILSPSLADYLVVTVQELTAPVAAPSCFQNKKLDA